MRIVSLLTVFLTCPFLVVTQSAMASAEDRFEPIWELLQKNKVPQWFENAKFGVLAHWGVDSVPAFDNEWYPHNERYDCTAP